MKLQVRGAVCVAILCLATAGYAQQGTNQSGTMNPGTAVSGSIVSVSNDVIVVRTDTGETMRFNRDASVNVPSNLMAGNRVSVEYNRIASDNMRLTRIALDDNADSRGTTSATRSGTTTGDRTTTSGTSGNSNYNNTTGDRATGSNTTGNSNYNNTTGDRATGSNTTGNSNYNNNATDNSNTGYSRLPQTASPLVMLAFAGLVSLGGALALRARRRR